MRTQAFYSSNLFILTQMCKTVYVFQFYISVCFTAKISFNFNQFISLSHFYHVICQFLLRNLHFTITFLTISLYVRIVCYLL